MTSGIPVTRGWVFVLKTGEVVIDWADGRVQDVMSGDFFVYDERDYGRPVQDTDLENLRNNGRVVSWDARTVYLVPLPEPPRHTID
jgi:hypothetical protein